MTRAQFNSLKVGARIRKRGTGTWYRVQHIDYLQDGERRVMRRIVCVPEVDDLTVMANQIERYSIAVTGEQR